MREEIGFGITIEQRLESCPDSMLLKFATFGKKVRILVLINYVGPEIGFAIMVGQNLDTFPNFVHTMSTYLSDCCVGSGWAVGCGPLMTNRCPAIVHAQSLSFICPRLS